MTRDEESGFTLLELVFAMVLLSIGIAALIGVLATSFRSVGVDIHRTDATAIAAQGLAELKATPVTGPLPSVSRNGQTYTLTGTVTPATATNGDVGAYSDATVTVTWTDTAGAHTVRQSAALAGPPPTTSAPICSSLGTVTPVVSTPPGDPSLDVSWQEPTGGPVVQWQVEISADGNTWTTAIADEQPLPVGATHQVEIGGLAATTAYQVEVVAITACGPVPPFSVAAGATPSVTSTACAPGSMTLGPATAEQVRSGAAAGKLTTDITIIVTTPGSCDSTGGILVVANTGEGQVSTPLSPNGPSSYVGTLPGLTQAWDLGVHEVDAFGGAGQVAAATLCVEPEGANSC